METGVLIFLIIFGIIVIAGLIWLVMWIIAKMKGKIIINLDKMEFAPGEEATGKITLILKNPLDADSLNIGLVGYQKTRSYSSGNNSSSTRTREIFNFNKPISGVKLYPAGESTYDFKLKIPADIVTRFSTGNNIADNMIKTAQILTGSFQTIKWYIKSNLDMKGVDISKKVQINIG